MDYVVWYMYVMVLMIRQCKVSMIESNVGPTQQMMSLAIVVLFEKICRGVDWGFGILVTTSSHICFEIIWKIVDALN